MAGGIYKGLYDFIAESENDLSFKRGDFIKVTQQINDDWYEGVTNTLCGHFPITYAERVLHVPCDRIGIAVNSFEGQENDDLSFSQDEVIGIVENIDSNWLSGYTNTNRGIFPASFVKEIDFNLSNDIVNNNLSHESDTIKTNGEHTSRTVPWAEAIDYFAAQEPDELTVNIGDGIELTSEIDSFWTEGIIRGRKGKFPSSFIKVITELPPELKYFDKQEDNEGENGLVANAKALYMFVGTREEEISFDKGDIIILTQRINQDWLEGRIGNSIGIFPANHVIIIVDLPYIHVNKAENRASDDSHQTHKQPPPRQSLPIKTKVVASTIQPSQPQCTTISPPAQQLQTGSSPVHLDRTVASPIRPQQPVFSPVRPDQPSSPPVQPQITRSTHKRLSFRKARAKLPTKVTHDTTVNHNGTQSNGGMPVKPKKPFSLKSKKKSPEHENNMHSFELTEEQIFHMDTRPSNMEGVENGLSENKPLKPKVPTRTASMSKPHIPARTLSMTKKIKAPVRPENIQHKNNDNESAIDLLSTSPPKPYKKLPKPLAPMPLTKPAPIKERPNTLNVNSRADKINPLSPLKSPVSSINHKSMSVAFTKEHNTSLQLLSNENTKFPRSETDPSIHKVSVVKKQPLTPEHSRSDTIRSLYFATSSSTSMMTPSPDKRCQTLDAMLQRSSSLRSTNKPNFPAPRKISEIKDGSATSSTRGSSDSLSQTTQSQELKRVEMEIAELKSKIEGEAHLLSGVETLLDFVSDDKRADLLTKQEKHKAMILDLNEDLNALEDEKSFLLASFGKLDDVKNRVNELETQIETYLDNCEQLRRMQDVAVVEELPEIRDHIEFCENMVDTLQDELNGLREKLSELGESDHADGMPDPELQLQKRKNNQRKVIEELVRTEKTYMQDMSLVANVMGHLNENENIDTEVLFANLPSIVELSSRLLARLNNACRDDLDADGIPSRLASCFIDMAAEMKECYSGYCHNYEEAIAMLEKYDENESTSISMKSAIQTVCNENDVAPFLLSSFLIKPVQRVLKYPLLLSELNKNHVGEGFSKEVLKDALNTVTDVATAINEFKRRKDLGIEEWLVKIVQSMPEAGDFVNEEFSAKVGVHQVQKYRETEDGIGKKVQKLNWHSVAKKSSRINQRITQFTGFNSQTVDGTFNEQEKRFRGLEKLIKVSLKNIVQFIEEFKENAIVEKVSAESIRQFYDEEKTSDVVVQYHNIISIITEQYSAQTVAFIQDHVTEPLSQLLQLFQGPFRLIQKRNDKCLDYDRAKNKAVKAKYTKEQDKIHQTQEELTLSQNIFVALNTQLLEELPSLCDQCSTFIKYCFSNFVEAYKRYFSKAHSLLRELWELPFVIKDINMFDRHQELIQKAMVQLASLAFIPANVNKDTTRRSQTQVVSSALIRASFFVDFDEVQNESTSPTHPLIDLSNDDVDTTDQVIKDSTEQTLHANLGVPPYATTCIVKFSFEAECEAELSLAEGTLVNILRKSDKTSNTEWWLVEHNGRKGYIPQSFLGEERRTRSFSDLNYSLNEKLKDEPLVPIRNTSGAAENGVSVDNDTSLSDSVNETGIRSRGSKSSFYVNGQVEVKHKESKSTFYAHETPTNPVNISSQESDGKFDHEADYNNTEDTRSCVNRVSEDTRSYKSSVASDGANASRYTVEYDFESLHAGELSVKEGTVLTVIRKYDQKGNSEWWYVEYDGQQGYVPRDYLIFVDESQMC